MVCVGIVVVSVGNFVLFILVEWIFYYDVWICFEYVFVKINSLLMVIYFVIRYVIINKFKFFKNRIIVEIEI